MPGTVERALVAMRGVALFVIGLYPLGAGYLLLVDDGWAVNRANVRLWAWVTSWGGRSVITPEDFAVLANIVLFVPFFAALAILIPRWRWVLVAAALSAGVEVYQGTLESRTSDLGDVVANTLGAGLGVGLGMVLRRLIASGEAPASPASTAPTTPGASLRGSADDPAGAPDDQG